MERRLGISSAIGVVALLVAACGTGGAASPGGSSPTPVTLVTVPDVTGLTLSEATGVLQVHSLSVGSVTTDTGGEGGQVVAEGPAPGSQVRSGTGIHLELGPSTVVPTDTPSPTEPPVPLPTDTPVAYASLSSHDWALLVKAPDSYTGNAYKVFACITQFDAATGATEFRAQASYRIEDYWFTNGSNAVFTGDATQLADFVQNDVVAVNVTSMGSLTYQTTLGGSTTVPEFQVDTIKRVGSC